MPRLSDKITLITGAARGIGAAIAERFIAEGATVWISDILAGPLQTLAARLGPRARALDLDVRDPAAWDRAIAQILAQDGRLDVLVNNAGITGLEADADADAGTATGAATGAATGPQDPEHCSLQAWHAVLAVTLDGTFLGCRAAIAAMRRNGGVGSIINMASRSGRVGVAGTAAYAAAKAAVINHTRSVALWCAQEGLAIRCNALNPGAILSPMWEPMLPQMPGPERDAALEALAADVPLGRMGRAQEVAAVAALLASDEATYITGADFAIDGGLMAGTPATPRR